jgi:hypothetical protein
MGGRETIAAILPGKAAAANAAAEDVMNVLRSSRDRAQAIGILLTAVGNA